MVVLRMRGNGKGQGRNKNNKSMNKKASLEQMGPKKWVVGSAACSNMLEWLKALALDPCEPEASKDSVRKLRSQTLKLRKVWHADNPGCTQKKRKLEQFLGAKFTKASGLASLNSNTHNVKKLGCKQLRTASGSPNLAVRNSCSSGSVLTFDSTFQRKLPHTDSNNSDNATKWGQHNKDFSFLVDTEESINGSNRFSSENLIVQDPNLEDASDLISGSNSSSSEEKLQQAVRLLITESEGENLPRAVIPIGPRFQAEIPEWMDPIKKENLYGFDDDLESLKWLGTKIWPIEGRSNTKNGSKLIGRGRPNSCSCASPGSTNCIKCHMLSARLDLQSKLGPAFLSWKFDEMGEVVSKAWTLKEQHMFESFVKNNPLSNGTGFWEAISKHFPSKCRKNILSYYYNVYIPRRMREQTRSFNQVDSDEDHIDDDEDENEDEDEDEDEDEGDNGGDTEISNCSISKLSSQR